MIFRAVLALALILPAPPALYEPRLEAAPCPVAVPAGTACGFLVVPERRDSPGKQVKVGYAVHQSASRERAADAVVYTSGGPASSSIQLTGYLSAMFPDRDVVVLEQRGSRYSEPRLACPETVTAMLDRLRGPGGQVAAAATACRDRLEREQGVDLRGYTTKEMAADVVELRRLLGYESWNLFGVSYSTRLMLDAAAADPEGVRSVVLDSFLPQEVSWYADADRNLTATLTALGAAGGFEALVRRLDAVPARVPATDPLTGRAFTARLTGGDVATVLAEALHEAEVIAVAPALVEALAAGHDELLRPLADAVGPGLTSHEFGLYHAVQCQDEMPATPIQSRLFTVNADKAVCDAWKLPTSAPTEGTTTAPVLVVGGQFDPTTPTRTSRPAAEKLPNARFVEFAGGGHAVFLSHRCAARTIAAFVADPARFTQPCAPDRRAYEPVRPGDLHVTGAPYQVLGGPWRAAPLALFAVASLVQLVAGAIRGRALTAFAGLSGLAFSGIVIDGVYGQAKVNETVLAVGVPSYLGWIGWVAAGSAVLTLVALARARRRWPHAIAALVAAGALTWWWAWVM
ncbi:alpha/beta hydrolase [Nonomuraea sp. NPDC046570]|uniref:alpha/beta hydrolase n=1 Tax=Nonomuraea sp. NPDC046570 TaxID=3155255 RepID=UPI0033CD68F2